MVGAERSVWELSCYWSMFSSIPGIYPLVAGSLPHHDHLKCLQVSPGGGAALECAVRGQHPGCPPRTLLRPKLCIREGRMSCAGGAFLVGPKLERMGREIAGWEGVGKAGPDRRAVGDDVELWEPVCMGRVLGKQRQPSQVGGGAVSREVSQ